MNLYAHFKLTKIHWNLILSINQPKEFYLQTIFKLIIEEILSCNLKLTQWAKKIQPIQVFQCCRNIIIKIWLT
jgi:hypothetical protein